LNPDAILYPAPEGNPGDVLEVTSESDFGQIPEAGKPTARSTYNVAPVSISRTESGQFAMGRQMRARPARQKLWQTQCARDGRRFES
jgi:hypothetical protein